LYPVGNSSVFLRIPDRRHPKLYPLSPPCADSQVTVKTQRARMPLGLTSAARRRDRPLGNGIVQGHLLRGPGGQLRRVGAGPGMGKLLLEHRNQPVALVHGRSELLHLDDRWQVLVHYHAAMIRPGGMVDTVKFFARKWNALADPLSRSTVAWLIPSNGSG
jgi:hypothetical protein